MNNDFIYRFRFYHIKYILNVLKDINTIIITKYLSNKSNTASGKGTRK